MKTWKNKLLTRTLITIAYSNSSKCLLKRVWPALVCVDGIARYEGLNVQDQLPCLSPSGFEAPLQWLPGLLLCLLPRGHRHPLVANIVSFFYHFYWLFFFLIFCWIKLALLLQLHHLLPLPLRLWYRHVQPAHLPINLPIYQWPQPQQDACLPVWPPSTVPFPQMASSLTSPSWPLSMIPRVLLSPLLRPPLPYSPLLKPKKAQPLGSLIIDAKYIF